MREEQAVWIAQNLSEATLSLDGDRSVHNTQRPTHSGGGSFDKVIRTAAIWKELGFRHGIRMTVCRDSVSFLTGSTETLCRLTSAASLKVEPVFLHGRAAQLGVAPPAARAFVSAFSEAHRLATAAGRRLVYSAVRPHVITTRFCEAAGNSFCITPDGVVTSCYEVTDPRDERMKLFGWGSWDDTAGCFRLDEGQRATQKRMDVRNQAACADCFCKYHCAGDCPAKRTWTDGGSQPDRLRCEITRTLYATMLAESLEMASSEAET